MAQNPTPSRRPRLAALATVYRKIMHPQQVIDRFNEGYGWKGQWHVPEVDVVSLYVDQIDPQAGDVFLDRTERHQKMKVYPTIADALTLGTGKLAVDGVIAVGEHGTYPLNEDGIMMHPHYEFFAQVMKVFRDSGRSVPYFNDKELSWKWDWCKEMVNTSKELKFPLQGGSSLAVCFRMPAVEFPLGAVCKQAVSVGYGGISSYDFHGLETLQCMVERRRGGEAGVEWIQGWRGDNFWEAYEKGVFPLDLVRVALSRSAVMFSGRQSFSAVFPTVEEMKRLVRNPLAYQYQHKDGLVSTMLLLDGLVRDFTFAVHIEGQAKPLSCQMYLPMQDGRTTEANFFSPLVHNAEQMFLTGKEQYPIERTLLTSGLLIAGVHSARGTMQREATPELAAIQYKPNPQSTFERE